MVPRVATEPILFFHCETSCLDYWLALPLNLWFRKLHADGENVSQPFWYQNQFLSDKPMAVLRLDENELKFTDKLQDLV